MSEIENLGRKNRFSHLGVGVFETLRLTRRQNGELGFATDLRQHLLRLEAGAKNLQTICPSYSEILEAIKEKSLGPVERPLEKTEENYRLRVLAMRDSWELDIEPFTPYQVPESGCNVVSVNDERCHPEYKSFSALTSVLAREYAESKNAFEAVLVDREGVLREGAWSNFFWLAEDGKWRTPTNRLLHGITRGVVIELLKSQLVLEDVSYTRIYSDAKEIFLTQATNGIVPVGKIDDKPLSSVSLGFCLRSQLQAVAWFPI